MFNQREVDIALIDAEAEVERVFQEWLEDYLGGRYAITGYDGAGAEEASGALGEGDEAAYPAGQPV